MDIGHEFERLQNYTVDRLSDDERLAFEHDLVSDPELVRELEHSLRLREALQHLREQGLEQIALLLGRDLLAALDEVEEDLVRANVVDVVPVGRVPKEAVQVGVRELPHGLHVPDRRDDSARPGDLSNGRDTADRRMLGDFRFLIRNEQTSRLFGEG